MGIAIFAGMKFLFQNLKELIEKIVIGNEVVNEAVRLLMVESEDLRQEVMVGIKQANQKDFVKFTATSIKVAGRKSLKAKGK